MFGEKTQAADAIRMRRNQAQLDARHLPEKARPDEQSKIPAAQQELEDRQAHVAVPHSGERELRALGGRRRVPRGRVERHVLAPDDQDADPIHEGDQQHLGEHRVAQPECRCDGRLEPRHGVLGNQVAFEELLQQGTHAPVHHELGNDQQGQRHQEADVNFHIQQKRYGRAAAQQVSFQSREHQERQPGEQRDDDDALAHQHQRIVGQVRPAQKLEERPAQDEREVRRIPEQIQTVGGLRGAGLHLQYLRAGAKLMRSSQQDDPATHQPGIPVCSWRG